MNNLTKNIILTPFNLLYKISPKTTIEILFKLKQGYKLNLHNPKTFNEKLQWIKLNVNNPLMPICCDKYTVRDFVKNQGCGEILNDLIWEGFSPEDIPFDQLPEQFVIKVTHGSSFNIICKEKDKLDKEKTISLCKKWLQAKFLPCYGEWFYGKVKPRVIVEKYIDSKKNMQLQDFKVFCFNGEPKLIRIDSDRFIDHKMDMFDASWQRIPNAHMGCHCSNYEHEKPECLDQLLEYARKLSSPFIHARVDFYIVENEIIFGEITFTDGAGFDKFSSYEFDLEMGKYLDLNNNLEK